MATTFSDIYDLFITTITDYQLKQYLDISEEAVETYLEPFLRFAVVQFERAYGDDISDKMDFENKTIEVDLKEREKVIIAMLMIQHWFRPVLNDLIDIQMGLSTTDFKRTSEAQHLKELESKYQQLREETSQLLTEYQLDYKVDWKEWQNGVFYK